MCHSTYTLLKHGDSWLLMVGNQIDTLIPDPSFSHNLCCKYSNGSCQPILDIYVLKAFQWYKEVFNLMSFDPWNYFMKIQNSIRTLTPKVGVHMGVYGFIPSHFITFRECKCDSHVTLSTCTFPCLCLGHKPKATVVTCPFRSFMAHSTGYIQQQWTCLHIVTKNERGDILNKHPNNSLVPCTLGVYEFLQQATSFILLFPVFVQEFACRRLLIFATYTTCTYIPSATLIPKVRVQDPTHTLIIHRHSSHSHNSAELITKVRTLKFYLQVTRQNANFFATAYVIQIRHLTMLSPLDQSS